MGKRQIADVGDSDKKTSSGVQGSGRFFFALAKILVDVIDDELQVSEAHKCAGKKVDPVKRALRVPTNVVSKVSNVSGQRRLGCNLFTEGWSAGCQG